MTKQIQVHKVQWTALSLDSSASISCRATRVGRLITIASIVSTHPNACRCGSICVSPSAGTCTEGSLQFQSVHRKGKATRRPAPLPPKRLGERWTTDFVHDQLIYGRAFRILTVFDDWSRESVLLAVVCQLPGGSVAGATADPPMLLASVDLIRPRRLFQIARA